MDSLWKKGRPKLAERERWSETERDGGGVEDEMREGQGSCELRHAFSRSRARSLDFFWVCCEK